MLIFNLLFFPYISAALGGLHSKINPITGKEVNAVPRWITLSAIFVVLGLQYYQEPVLLAAYLWVFWVIRLAPTNALLFPAVHGWSHKKNDTDRHDNHWQFLIDATEWACKKLKLSNNYYAFGIIYGALRSSLALPAIAIIGNWWMLIFLAIGLFYFAAGYVHRNYNGKDNVRFVEAFIGFLYALFLI